MAATTTAVDTRYIWEYISYVPMGKGPFNLTCGYSLCLHSSTADFLCHLRWWIPFETTPHFWNEKGVLFLEVQFSILRHRSAPTLHRAFATQACGIRKSTPTWRVGSAGRLAARACGIRPGRLLRFGVWDPPVGFCETMVAAAAWASVDDHNFDTFFRASPSL